MFSLLKSIAGFGTQSDENVIRVKTSHAHHNNDSHLFSDCLEEFAAQEEEDNNLVEGVDGLALDGVVDDDIGFVDTAEEWNDEWNALEDTVGQSCGQLLDTDAKCPSIKGVVTQCINESEMVVDGSHRIRYDRCTFGRLFTGDLVNVETNENSEIVVKPLRYKILTGKITAYESSQLRYIFSRHAFIRKTEETEHLRVGDVTKVIVIETATTNVYNWRAIPYDRLYDPGARDEDQIEAFTNELMENKNSIEVLDRISFGEMKVQTKKTILIFIKNRSNKRQTLVSVDVEEGENQINFHSFRSTYTKPTEAPYIIPAHSECYVELICDAKYCGDYNELIIFVFDGFKIGRFITVTVVDSGAVGGPVERRRIYGADTWIVPGERVWNPSKHIFDKLEKYRIPETLWRAIENNWKIESVFPEVKQKLSKDNYRRKFHALVHLEELENHLCLERFEMVDVQFRRSGRFLALTVPGLADGRPSLIMGDKILTFDDKNRDEDKRIGYEGFIHEIRKDEILIRFNEDFHREFSGGAFKVMFQMGRTTYRRCHHAIDLSPHLVDQVLFAHKVILKQSLKKFPYESINWFNRSLNAQQKLAVIGVLKGQCRPTPYIIFGPPGTGKTVTVVESILQVFDKIPHSRVIACTSANSSADLIAMKLLESGRITEKDLIRVTALHRVNSIPDSVKKVTQIADEDEKKWIYHRIIVTTSSQAGVAFKYKISPSHFTHVFIDEAAQLIEPESLIPISMSAIGHGVVVLAGDHKQLGPVVQSPLARDGRLDRSLMERLMTCCEPYERSDNYKKFGYYNPRFVTKLVQNYRSDEQIMAIPSLLFYDNELKYNCKTDVQLLKSLGLEIAVNFIGVRGDDRQDSDCPSWYNPQEIIQVCTQLDKLYEAGVQPEDIGIITPYRKQAMKIRTHILDMGLMECKVATIEEFQGLEKRVILVSMVRSSDKHLSHDMRYRMGFVHNKKRFNVAVSRAMALLICVGDPYLLSRSQDYCWQKLIDYCLANGSYKGCPYRNFDPKPCNRRSPLTA